MNRYIKILSFILLIGAISSCQKDPEYAEDSIGVDPCLKWQVEYIDGYKKLGTNVGDNGLTITAELLGKANLGGEVQYAILPIGEDGNVAKLSGDFRAELQFRDFISTPDGATFEVIVGGHTGTTLSLNGTYAGSVGSSPNDNEGFGIYNNTGTSYTPINTYNKSTKFLDAPTKNVSGLFLFERVGEDLYITVKSGYGSVTDTVKITMPDVDLYLQMGTNAQEDVSASITLERFTVSGMTGVNAGGEPSNAVRSDNFDCYSIRLNR